MPVDMKKYRTARKYRKRVIDAVIRYNQTKKGRECQQRARNKKIKEGYYSKYMKKKRKKARREGICQMCFKRKVYQKGRSICSRCQQ